MKWKIYGKLKNKNQDLTCQWYDGASAMSGESSGVQTRFKNDAVYAFRIHCCAHNLNLSLIAAVSVNTEMKIFFSYL